MYHFSSRLLALTFIAALLAVGGCGDDAAVTANGPTSKQPTGNNDKTENNDKNPLTCEQGFKLCGDTCVDTSSDLAHCGACNNACGEGGANTVASCQGGMCTLECEAGFQDLDNDINYAGGTGCESSCTPTNGGVEICDGVDNNCDGRVDEGFEDVGESCTAGEGVCQATGEVICKNGEAVCDATPLCECSEDDPIDDDGTDSNCDGVDGVLTDSVFVSADTGHDTDHDGLTPEAPLATLSAALQAAADAGRHHILVAGGDYDGALILQNGVSIYGGYVPGGFARDTANQTTRIRALAADFDATTTDYITVRAADIDQPTTLDHLTIQGFDALNSGASTMALHALNSPGLVVKNSHIISAIGADGSAGSDGPNLACRTTVDGAPLNGAGGKGGIQRHTSAPCGISVRPQLDGENGENYNETTGTGVGGRGGNQYCDRSQGMGIRPRLDGQHGQNGTPGEPGEAGQLPATGDLGSFDATGAWAAAEGTSPTQGGVGGGGGGGGAGGDYELEGSYMSPGANGGDGGHGGCNGFGGGNGAPGGSSFGVVVIGATVTLADTTIDLGQGGSGGKGGVGSPGEAGKPGKPGGSGTGNGGDGGNGGTGGDGGSGGNGVGGQGGNAIGLATFNATLSTSGVSFQNTSNAPASGGAATPPAEAGRDGAVAQTHDFGS